MVELFVDSIEEELFFSVGHEMKREGSGRETETERLEGWGKQVHRGEAGTVQFIVEEQAHKRRGNAIEPLMVFEK